MLSYPIRFFKIGGYLIWINYHANGTWQSKTLARRNAFHSLFSTNKAKLKILFDFVVSVIAAHLL